MPAAPPAAAAPPPARTRRRPASSLTNRIRRTPAAPPRCQAARRLLRRAPPPAISAPAPSGCPRPRRPTSAVSPGSWESRCSSSRSSRRAAIAKYGSTARERAEALERSMDARSVKNHVAASHEFCSRGVKSVKAPRLVGPTQTEEMTGRIHHRARPDAAGCDVHVHRRGPQRVGAARREAVPRPDRRQVLRRRPDLQGDSASSRSGASPPTRRSGRSGSTTRSRTTR